MVLLRLRPFAPLAPRAEARPRGASLAAPPAPARRPRLRLFHARAVAGPPGPLEAVARPVDGDHQIGREGEEAGHPPWVPVAPGSSAAHCSQRLRTTATFRSTVLTARPTLAAISWLPQPSSLSRAIRRWRSSGRTPRRWRSWSATRAASSGPGSRPARPSSAAGSAWRAARPLFARLVRHSVQRLVRRDRHEQPPEVLSPPEVRVLPVGDPPAGAVDGAEGHVLAVVQGARDRGEAHPGEPDQLLEVAAEQPVDGGAVSVVAQVADPASHGPLGVVHGQAPRGVGVPSRVDRPPQ